jgi:glycosyltransferase involved in cell wall biosynthesis
LNANLAEKEMRSREHKPVVLTTVPYYLPGFKGGGKLITVRNLVAALSSQFQFKVLTADRDLGDAQSYEGIPPNQWVTSGDCEIFYADSRRGSLQSIREQLCRTDYDVLHLNTVFSRPFGIVPLLLRRFGRIARRPTVIAPRGELAPGAVAIKSGRKKSFLAVARGFGLFDGVMWQASGDEEAREIRSIFGSGARIAIAADLLSAEYQSWRSSQYRKYPGQLDIVFLSRITPKKNLHLAIEALRGLDGDITFRIVGPIDDSQYWVRCRKLIAILGSNIRIDYSGPIATSEVGNCFGRHGLFFLPTANENFGCVILEALLAGCPVLISDQTPWRDLAEKGVGWDIPLSRPDLIRATLQHCIAMDAQSHRSMSNRAREFALDYVARDDSATRNAAMFHWVLGEHPTTLVNA